MPKPNSKSRFRVAIFTVTLIMVVFTSFSGCSIGEQELAESKDPVFGNELKRFLRATNDYPDGISGGVMVAKGGKILVAEGFGQADQETGRKIDRDTLWDVASITKQFTAAGILILVQQGKLGIDDTLEQHFQEVPDDKKLVTLKQLLNHTSGIAGAYDAEAAKDVDFASKSSAINFYLKLPMVSEPGSKWSYSNLAYNLLAAVIESVSSQSWEEFMRQEVLIPAGMRSSFALGDPDLPKANLAKGDKGAGLAFPYGEVSHWAGYRGAGGIHVTLDDLFCWDQALRGDKLLNESSKAVLFEPGLNHYALGWRIKTHKSGETLAYHGGAVRGFISHFVRSLDQDLSVAVLTNVFAPGEAAEIANLILDLVFANEVIVPAKSLVMNDEDLDRRAGRYYSSSGGFIDVKRVAMKLNVAVCDWGFAQAILKQRGKMVNAGGTVNSKLAKAIESLRGKERTQISSRVTSAQIEDWKSALSEGVMTQILGYYFPETAHIDQFAHFRIRGKSTLVRFHWFAGRLTEVEVNPKAMVALEFANAGPGVFRSGSNNSWRASLIRFEGDRLHVNGLRAEFRRKP